MGPPPGRIDAQTPIRPSPGSLRKNGPLGGSVEPNGAGPSQPSERESAFRKQCRPELAKRGGTAVPPIGRVVLAGSIATCWSDMTYPKSGPDVPPSPRFPSIEARGAGVLARRRHLPGEHRAARGRAGVGLLRRPAVRERPPALRAPAHRLRQGRVPPLPDDDRPPRRPRLRVGHARPARRARGDEAARHHREGRDRDDGHRRVQRQGPRVGAGLHARVGGLRRSPGPLGRLRARLQDARHELHGERALGVQDALRQGPRLRGLPRAALLLARRDAAERARAADG